MLSSASLLFAVSCTSFASTQLSIDGFGTTGTSVLSQATGQQTLFDTHRGRITVIADEGTWNLLAVDISVRQLGVGESYPPDVAQLVATHPWLVPVPQWEMANLAGSLTGFVDPASLANATGTELRVSHQVIAGMVLDCVDAEDDVKQYGQPVLQSATSLTWQTQFSLWTSSPVWEFWATTFSHPGNFGPAATYDVVDWLRLAENAALQWVGEATWRQIARSGDLERLADFGLRVHIHAVSLRGNPDPGPGTTPANTPGLVVPNPADKPIFRISQPVTIAIAYLPPEDLPPELHYLPGVIDPSQPSGTLTAAIGRMTSATHALFPAGEGDGEAPALAPLLRYPHPEGPIAFFDVPPGAVAGDVHFVDLVGINESALIPIDPFLWNPSVPPDSDAGKGE